jgi:hypothetical protein
MRRSVLASLVPVLGAAIGVGLTLAAGTVCVDGVDESFCGLNFLVWDLSTPVAITLAAVLGYVLGVALVLVAGIVFVRRPPP